MALQRWQGLKGYEVVRWAPSHLTGNVWERTKYRVAMREKLLAFWNHPAGPRTIHFWAPTWKWSLVVAQLGDILYRDPSETSIANSVALCATGLIWARYSTQITPVNMNLLSVNVFVGGTGLYAIYQKMRYSQKPSDLDEGV